MPQNNRTKVLSQLKSKRTVTDAVNCALQIADRRLPRIQGSGIGVGNRKLEVRRRSSILELHPVTLSPCHPFTLSPCHPLTLSRRTRCLTTASFTDIVIGTQQFD